MEKLRFHEFFSQAWRASVSQKLAWVFGIIVGISSIAATRPDIVLPYIFYLNKFTTPIFSEKVYSEAFLIFIWLALLFVVGVFGEGNLISSLSYISGKTNFSNYPNTPKAAKHNFFRALLVDGLALCLLLIAIGIISLPIGIASARNPDAMRLLTTLGLLTLTPIIIVIFFIRQYALFYFLFSPLSLRGAVETASALFSRFFSRSLAFGVFFVALTIFFTFCVELITLGIVFLARQISVPLEEGLVSLVASFVFFVWFAIFQQALWLAFFKSIAGTRDTQKSTEEKSAVFTDNLPEIPPVKN